MEITSSDDGGEESLESSNSSQRKVEVAYLAVLFL